MDDLPYTDEFETLYTGFVARTGVTMTRHDVWRALAGWLIDTPGQPPANPPPPIAESPKLDRRRWAILIQRIYQTDPLRCPKCGGAMKIISFIEARQEEVIRKILQHCGLWHDPPARAPPRPAPTSQSAGPIPDLDPGFTPEPDPDFLDHAHREEFDQPDLPWES